MTAKLSSTTYQPAARGRIRTLAVTTAVALAIGAGLASTSQAAVGNVYFDQGGNTAAGGTLFNEAFIEKVADPTAGGTGNVGLGPEVMPNLDSSGGLFNAGLNTAIGSRALLANTTGSGNVATGTGALLFNKTGNNNVALGLNALVNVSGSDNVGIGRNAGQNLTSGNNNIAIGNAGRLREARTIWIGGDDQNTTFIAGISGTTLGGAAQPVFVSSQGQLGTKPGGSASTASLAATVERLQRQVRRLRERVKGG